MSKTAKRRNVSQQLLCVRGLKTGISTVNKMLNFTSLFDHLNDSIQSSATVCEFHSTATGYSDGQSLFFCDRISATIKP